LNPWRLVRLSLGIALAVIIIGPHKLLVLLLVAALLAPWLLPGRKD
jgi:hypothetical protein